MSPVGDGARRYASDVARRLDGLSRGQRRELAADLQLRLGEAGATTWDSAVAAFGHPVDYAAELAPALAMPPQRRRRWPWVLGVLVLLGLVGAVQWMRRNDVPRDYPLRTVAFTRSGAGSSVGSVLLMPARPGEPVTVAVQLVNLGDRAVRVDGVAPFVGVDPTDGGVVELGAAGAQPLWDPRVRVFPPDPSGTVVVTSFDDPSGTDFAPFSIDPNGSAVVQLQGPVEYCVDAPGASVGDHIRIEFTVGGERREAIGPELSFPLGRCS